MGCAQVPGTTEQNYWGQKVTGSPTETKLNLYLCILGHGIYQKQIDQSWLYFEVSWITKETSNLAETSQWFISPTNLPKPDIIPQDC